MLKDQKAMFKMLCTAGFPNTISHRGLLHVQIGLSKLSSYNRNNYPISESCSKTLPWKVKLNPKSKWEEQAHILSPTTSSVAKMCWDEINTSTLCQWVFWAASSQAKCLWSHRQTEFYCTVVEALTMLLLTNVSLTYLQVTELFTYSLFMPLTVKKQGQNNGHMKSFSMQKVLRRH